MLIVVTIDKFWSNNISIESNQVSISPSFKWLRLSFTLAIMCCLMRAIPYSLGVLSSRCECLLL